MDIDYAFGSDLDAYKEKDVFDTLKKYLNDREWKVYRMCLGLGCKKMTWAEVGEEFDVTRERIRQIITKATGKVLHGFALSMVLKPLLLQDAKNWTMIEPSGHHYSKKLTDEEVYRCFVARLGKFIGHKFLRHHWLVDYNYEFNEQVLNAISAWEGLDMPMTVDDFAKKYKIKLEVAWDFCFPRQEDGVIYPKYLIPTAERLLRDNGGIFSIDELAGCLNRDAESVLGTIERDREGGDRNWHFSYVAKRVGKRVYASSYTNEQSGCESFTYFTLSNNEKPMKVNELKDLLDKVIGGKFPNFEEDLKNRESIFYFDKDEDDDDIIGLNEWSFSPKSKRMYQKRKEYKIIVKDAIIEVLKTAKKPIGRSEIIKRAREKYGDDVSDSPIVYSVYLNHLVESRKILKTGSSNSSLYFSIQGDMVE